MKTRHSFVAGIGVALFALALGPAYGDATPWGEAWGGGQKRHDLTRRTTSDGACLDTSDLAADVDEVRFASGRILVDHIDIEGRDIRFVGASTGGRTTLVPDPESFVQVGAICVTGARMSVTNLTFSGFYAETAGGAISLWSATEDCAIQDCRFENCKAAAYDGVGGAIYASAAAGTSATLAITGCSFVGCEAANGGAVTTERIYPYKEKAIALSISDCSFANNGAGYMGGAIWNEGDVKLARTSFAGCHGGQYGGAICSGTSDDAADIAIDLLPGVTFDGNRVTDDCANGGAIALMSPGIRLVAERAAFRTNTADFVGGAIFSTTNNFISLSTSIFSNNVVASKSGYGGALAIDGSTCALTNLTVRGSNGGALDLCMTDAQFVNCVVVDNGDLDICATTLADETNTLKLDYTAYGKLYSEDAIAVTTNACLAGRAADIYDGDKLYLRESPYNPVAAEGLPQTANDYDGVAYGSREVGTSMGAYECPTAVCTGAEGWSGVYDGAGHAIVVSSLCENVTFTWRYSTTGTDPYGETNPAYTNVGTYTTWAIATADGFRPMTNSATIVIAKRVVQVTSGSESWSYDGQEHSNTDVTVTKGDFVEGEGITSNNFNTITTVGTNDNWFTVGWLKGTSPSNYDFSVVTGKIAVLTAKMPPPDHEPTPGPDYPPEAGPFPGPFPEPVNPPTPTNNTDGSWQKLSNYDLVTVYDGQGHTFDTNALWTTLNGMKATAFFGNEPTVTYSLTGEKETWVSDPFFFTNVTETPTSFWYQVEVANFTNYVHAAAVIITNRPVTITFEAANKIFDTTPTATCTATNFANVVTEVGDAFAFDTTGIDFNFDSPNVGDGKLVTASNYGDVTNRVVAVGETLKSNYSFHFVPTTTASITAASFVYTFDFVNTQYDGTNYQVSVSFPNGRPDKTTVEYALDPNGTWLEETDDPTFRDVTNVTVYVKVTNPNYATMTNSTYVNIFQRKLTLAGPDKTAAYTGAPLTFGASEISDSGSKYVPGECFDYTNFASRIELGRTPSTFTCLDSGTAKLSNYEITYDNDHYLVITPSEQSVGVESLSICVPYDGTAHGAGWIKHNENNLVAGDAIDAELDGRTVTYPSDGVVSNTFKYARILRDGKDVTASYPLFVIVTGTLQVVNATFQNVTATGIDKVYDGAPASITVNVNDVLASGDEMSKLAKIAYSLDGVTYKAESPALSNVVSATVWYRVTADYFNPYTNSATIKITPRPVTFTSQDGMKVYDGEPLYTDTNAITQVGMVASEVDGVSFVNPGSATTLADSGKPASFDVVFDNVVALAANYSVTKNFGKLYINDADAVVLRADSHEFAYEKGEGAQRWPYYTVTGLREGEGVQTVDWDPTSAISKPSDGTVSNIITHAVITNAAGHVLTDRKITYLPGELTMAKGSLEGLVLADDIEKIYDGFSTNIVVVVDTNALVDVAATVTITYKTSEGGTWNPENPPFTGYTKDPVTVSYRVEVPEYEEYIGSATVMVHLREVTLESASASKTYDGNELTAKTVTIVDGTMAPGEFLAYDCTGSQTDVGSSANVFTASVTNLANDADLKANYHFTEKQGTLTVDPAAIEFEPVPFIGPYDGIAHTNGVAATNLPPNALCEYSYDGCVTWTNEPAVFKDVTNILVYVRVSATNYNPRTVPTQLTINRRTLTLMAPNKWTYWTGEPFTFDGSEIQAGGQQYAEGECFTYSDFASQTEIGQTESTFKYEGNATTKLSNYDVTVVPNRYLTVLPDPDKIAVLSHSGNWAYDGKPHGTNGYDVIDNGKLLEGDRVVAVPNGAITYPGLASNTFESVKVMRGDKDVTGNYTNLVTVLGLLKVVNADFQEGEVAADVIDRKYDGTPTSIVVRVDNPIARNVVRHYSLDGVTFSEKNPAFTNAVDTTTVWYEVTADYFNAYTNKTTVTISKRTIGYKSLDDSKLYDGTPLEVTKIVALTEGYDGFVTGEGATTQSAASLSSVGECEAKFDVVFNEGTIAGNYSVTKEYGTLRIFSKDGLTVTAGSQEFTYDGHEHRCSNGWTIVGLKPGDGVQTITFDGVITRPDQSPVANNIVDLVITNADGIVEIETAYTSCMRYAGELTMPYLSLEDFVTSEGAAKVYDGAPTNITVTVDKTKLVGNAPNTVEILYSASPKGPFEPENPTYTEASEYPVYFVVRAEGYAETAIRSETVSIGLRNVQLVSASATRAFIEGTPLKSNDVWCATGEGLYDLAPEQYLWFNCTTSQLEVGSCENVFDFAITNAAGGASLKNNYFVSIERGILTVTPAKQEKDDPADPPAGALTPYDYIGMYDGQGHTVAPFDVTKPETGWTLSYSFDGTNWTAGVGKAVPAAFHLTNVCDKVAIWIKSAAPNYADVVTNGFVTITNRPVHFKADDKTSVYGQAFKDLTYTTNIYPIVAGDTVHCALTSDALTVKAVGEYDIVTAAPIAVTTLGFAGSNYLVTFEKGVYTVTKEMPPPLDPEDPAHPFPPEAGPFYEDPNDYPPSPVTNGVIRALSNYDVVTVYDGQGHTFDYASLTNAIATNDWASTGYKVTYSFDGAAGSWTDDLSLFTFTNVVATSFWYNVETPYGAPNYSNYIHAVGVTVTNRPITITFTADDKIYDTTTTATCSATNFANVVAGERFAFDTTGVDFDFDTADVGTNKLVTATNYGDVTNRVIELGMGLKSNYSFHFVPTTRADIRRATMPVEAFGALREYDGAATNIQVVVNHGGMVGSWYAIYYKPDAAIPTNDYEYAVTPEPDSKGWTEAMPLFRNVATNSYAGALSGYGFDGTNGSYVVHYRVEFQNYETVSGFAAVTVTPRKVSFMFPPVAKTFDGGDAFPTNVVGGVLVTNLLRSSGHNMVGEEMFTAYGWGKYSSSNVGGGGEYLMLTNIQTVAYNGAQDRNYRKEYCVLAEEGVKPLGIVETNKYGKTTLNGVEINENSPVGSGGVITPREENPDHDDYPPPDKKDQPDGKTPKPAPEPTVPLSYYDTTNVYDGAGHTMNTNALWETVCGPNRKYIIDDEDLDKVEFHYSLDGMEWSTTPLTFTNVTVTSFWYRVSAPNYATNCHPVMVVILKREINVQANLQTMVYDDFSSLTPGFNSPKAWSDATKGVTDKGLAAGQSIANVKLWFRDDDWSTRYQGGTSNAAVIVLTNWTGGVATSIKVPEGDSRVIISNATADVSRNYDITFTAGDLVVDENLPLFKATLKWMYVSDSFVAQLTIVNTNKTSSFRYKKGSLRFCFEDREDTEYGDMKLWDWTTNSEQLPVEKAGRAFYLEDPDPEDSIGGWGKTKKKVYGPPGNTATLLEAFDYRGKSPFVWVEDRTAPLKSALNDYYATLVWTTLKPNGKTGKKMSIRIVAQYELPPAGTTGSPIKKTTTTAKKLKAVASAMPTAPATLTQVNTAAAYGLACDPSSASTCALTAFSVSDDTISGRVETSNAVSTGTPTTSAVVKLLGATTPGGTYSTIDTISTKNGVFETAKPAGYQFFKVSVGVGSSVFK